MEPNQVSNITKALYLAQRDIPPLRKGSENKHFGNRYISLDDLMETVKPVLEKHDLLLMQLPSIHENQPALTTSITHVPTGEEARSQMLLMLDKDNPQGQGSAITYARRYSLMAILGLVADEDDDGEKASRQTHARITNITEDGYATGTSPI